jgi:hypothetical protein
MNNELILINNKVRIVGGYSGEVLPLPFPNRVVKLTCADGTASLNVGE